MSARQKAFEENFKACNLFISSLVNSDEEHDLVGVLLLLDKIAVGTRNTATSAGKDSKSKNDSPKSFQRQPKLTDLENIKSSI